MQEVREVSRQKLAGGTPYPKAVSLNRRRRARGTSEHLATRATADLEKKPEITTLGC